MKRIAETLVLAAFLSATLLAQDLRVTSGAVDDQVLQRGPDGQTALRLAGVAEGSNGKSVDARVLRKHTVVVDWSPLGQVSGGKWTGELKNLATGGPYRVEFRIGGKEVAFALSNILVGDLWVLAGQSNMEGLGDLQDVEPPNELVHNFDMADRWMVAEEPLHTLPSAADRVHWRLNDQKQPERYEGEKLRKYTAERKKGAGMGLPFAVEMVKRTGVPIGLLSCAHGGTSMDQWDPALKDKGGDSLYGSMLRRFRAAGGKVTGLLWYQGESDANVKAAAEFPQKFERFVAKVREDFQQPDMPFYYVQIGRHVSNQSVPDWHVVQEAQRQAEAKIPHSGMIAAIDVTLDDQIHVGTADQKRLGHRMANLACRDLFPKLAHYGQVQRGPHPVSAKVEGQSILVTFTEVNGHIVSTGRPTGFSIRAADGAVTPTIYKIQTRHGEGHIVELKFTGKLPENATLFYGDGKDPYCNLHDEADMGVPVFGPMAIQ
jgi:sialate O-acetylesterase